MDYNGFQDKWNHPDWVSLDSNVFTLPCDQVTKYNCVISTDSLHMCVRWYSRDYSETLCPRLVLEPPVEWTTRSWLIFCSEWQAVFVRSICLAYMSHALIVNCITKVCNLQKLTLQASLPEVVFQANNKWAFNLATTVQLQLQRQVKQTFWHGANWPTRFDENTHGLISQFFTKFWWTHLYFDSRFFVRKSKILKISTHRCNRGWQSTLVEI